ncbi:MAG: methyltransferase domain-containing protein [Thermoanaerobaculia bacterium]
MIQLLCSVRGCGLPLTETNRTFVCASGHAFDRARSGYVNLLQPQDRRAARPGDTKAAVLARRRLLDDGYAERLSETLCAFASEIRAVTVLDAGCGEGSHLGRLTASLRVEGSGVDISVDAIELAAKRHHGILWVVANADRKLPYADNSFDLVTSITARRNAPEFARVLRRGGGLFIAVPAPDDLAELRAAVQGQNDDRSRVETVTSELGEFFALAAHETVREQRELERSALLALLHATYRGLRRGAEQRVASLDRLVVTFAWDVLIFRRRDSV